MPAMSRMLIAASMAMLPGQAIVLNKADSEGVSPVRKVINLLEKMSAKIEAQGKEEGENFEKFQCWCTKTLDRLKEDIAVATSPSALSESDIRSAQGDLDNVKADISQLKTDKVTATASLEQAAVDREKSHEEFVQKSTHEKETFTAAGEALEILTGKTGDAVNTAMLQSTQSVDKLMSKANVSPKLKKQVAALLSGAGTAHKRHRGKQTPDLAVGSLSEIKRAAEREFQKLTDAENAEQTTFGKMREAKRTEIITMEQQLQTKQQRAAELRVHIVDTKAQLKDQIQTLAANRKMQADTQENCDTTAKQVEQRTKTRNEEILAISETKKILSDDDALDLFRKTVKTPKEAVLLQEPVKMKALDILKKVGKPSPQMNLLSVVLSSKAVNFTKVEEMIQNMVNLLIEEGLADIKKKDYCTDSFHQNNVIQTGLNRDMDDLNAGIKDKDTQIKLLADETKDLRDGLKVLKEQTDTATANRKAETAEFNELVASNTAAIGLLNVAQNRMNKFYNPTEYVAVTTPSPYELGFVQISEHKNILTQAPQVFDGSFKANKGGNGVLSMLKSIVGDLTLEIKMAKQDEAYAARTYDKAVDDAADKTSADQASIREKLQTKADLEQGKVKQEGLYSSKDAEMASAKEVEKNLHDECDWMLKNIDERKKARDVEVLALKDAKSTLAGANIAADPRIPER
eukprot:TRINITY_DN93544_c0_g1_i1.p1 TRINITY_DN93544_c0_g1~~TRINITY_DN93544_c0_g1_i1.p1  ORF type:complete len:688 (+),score=229.13 TRINITY_DN93544_c0_g1_i1:99-2162(+)